MNDFRKSFYKTALESGLPVISKDNCCRLLAWLYIYGGGNERVIDEPLSAKFFYAQNRLNLKGGEIPDGEAVASIQEYIKSVTGEGMYSEFFNKNGKYDNPPDWVLELEREYGIKSGRDGGNK
jgi:hypothetical protein